MTSSVRRCTLSTIVILAIVAGGLMGMPGPAISAWNIGDPIVTYWAGPGYDGSVPLTDAVAAQMVDVGMNVVWAASAEEVVVAGRHGLRAMYQNRSVLLPQNLNDPVLRAQLDKLVDGLRNRPGLYSYHLVDEPGASQFDGLGRLVAYLRQRDPDHLAYIDLFPNYASPTEHYGTKDYNAYLDRFISTVKPSLLSYDHYQFMAKSDTGLYLQNLSEVSQKAKAAGIPFMNIVQAASWEGTRIPTSNQERFLAYTTLAYGAQGISYYVWCWPGHQGGIVDSKGAPTAIYNTLKATNREFVAIAKQYRSLKSIGAYLKGYDPGHLPPGTAQLPSNSPLNIRSVADDMTYSSGQPLKGVLFGFFGKNGTAVTNATVAIAVNLDYTTSKTYTVNGPGNLSVFNASTGKWTATGRNSATVELLPGGGVLVGLTSAVP